LAEKAECSLSANGKWNASNEQDLSGIAKHDAEKAA
jgi:hypothetical protein